MPGRSPAASAASAGETHVSVCDHPTYTGICSGTSVIWPESILCVGRPRR